MYTYVTVIKVLQNKTSRKFLLSTNTCYNTTLLKSTEMDQAEIQTQKLEHKTKPSSFFITEIYLYILLTIPASKMFTLALELHRNQASAFYSYKTSPPFLLLCNNLKLPFPAGSNKWWLVGCYWPPKQSASSQLLSTRPS